MNIYNFSRLLPNGIKKPIKYVYGLIPVNIRLGKVFWDTYKFLQESEWWSREKLAEYQFSQLKKLLKHAYDNVPYYRDLFNQHDIKIENINDLNDFKKIPYLDKDSVKKNVENLIAKNFNKKDLFQTHTSGTTGKPLQFYEDLDCQQKEWAFVCHQWARVGYKPGNPRIELRGGINRQNPIFYDPAHKVLRLSPLIENKELVKIYIEKIERSCFEFLHGYPSAIASFAFAIKKYGLKASFSLKACLFASEIVYKWQREIVNEVFGCRAFSFYGITERVTIAGECEYCSKYHCTPQYAITEIDENTKEIIGTGFINYATPFIRYRTTDIAKSFSFSACKRCGRNYFPIINEIEGRLGDFIITPEGNFISPAAVTHPFKDLKSIKDVQIIQKDIDLILLLIVPWDNSESDLVLKEATYLTEELKKMCSPLMNIKYELVNNIEKGPSGKTKWIISNISKDFIKTGLK
jgi:phenylacetate-CoA ligase